MWWMPYGTHPSTSYSLYIIAALWWVVQACLSGGLPHDATDDDVVDALWDSFGRIILLSSHSCFLAAFVVPCGGRRPWCPRGPAARRDRLTMWWMPCENSWAHRARCVTAHKDDYGSCAPGALGCAVEHSESARRAVAKALGAVIDGPRVAW